MFWLIESPGLPGASSLGMKIKMKIKMKMGGGGLC